MKHNRAQNEQVDVIRLDLNPDESLHEGEDVQIDAKGSETKKSHHPRSRFAETMLTAFGFLLVFTLITGMAYPALATGFGQLLFHNQVNGSVITIDGQQYGSSLLAQYNDNPARMQGRWMILDTTSYKDAEGNPLLYAKTENKAVADSETADLFRERAEQIAAENPAMAGVPVPEDLVTVSGSGLDPEISLSAARYQAPRIAQKAGMSEDQVNAIIDSCTSHKVLGIFGEETVNVLKVNLMLDGKLSA